MTEIRAVRAEIEHAITAGGLDDDPLGLMMRAIASSCEVMTEASERIVEAKQTPFEPAVVASLARAVAKDVPGVVRQQATTLIADQVHRQARSWAWIYCAAGASLLAIGVVLGVVGRGAYDRAEVDNANRRADGIAAEIHETEAGLREAFAVSPTGAEIWLNVMRWNDPKAVQQACLRNPVAEPSGRPACGLTIWSAPVKPTAPKPVAPGAK